MDSTKVNDEFLKKTDTWKQFLIKTVNTHEEILNFVKELPVFIIDLIKSVGKWSNGLKLTKKQYFYLLTYLMRFPSFYKLFKSVFAEKSLPEEAEKEIQTHLNKQLLLMLEHVVEIVFNCPEDTTVGSFLNLMDSALDNITEIDIKSGLEFAQSNLSTSYTLIEEILCLSMSIAQVGCSDDNKIINGGCRSVLNSIESIKTEINKENPNLPMCNLVVDACSDTLCAFEAKVNTAVLRLCLYTFSEFKTPLNSLFNFCLNCDTSTNDETIDSFVIEFDLQMDRIFQIALFSVASSTIGNSVAEIKNIIANLEFLEGELVPSFIALTKSRTPSRLSVAKILKEIWKKQISLLRKAVHGVIEPSAYCKLVHEELKIKAEELRLSILNENIVPEIIIRTFLNYTSELGVMTTTSITSFDQTTQANIRKELQIVYNVRNELSSAYTVLNNDDRNAIKIINQRIFKRCHILLTSIKRLWLAMLNNKEHNVDEESPIKHDSNIKKLSVEDNSPMNKIICRGKQILKDRSMCQINLTVRESCLENTIVKDQHNLIYSAKKSNNRKYGYCNKSVLHDNNDLSLIEQLIPQLEQLRI